MFNSGDMVFAKLKGYPYWPAEIKELISDESGKPIKHNVTFFGDGKTAIVKECDLYPYNENTKLTLGKTKTDNFRNKKLNEALFEAEKLYLSRLENSLVENNYFEDTENEHDKLELAAKIGSALLEENKILKEQNLRLEAKLTSFEAKIEDQLEREKQFTLESQTIYEENDRKLGQAINEYTKKIKDLEKETKLLKSKVGNSDETTLSNIRTANVSVQTVAPNVNQQSQPASNSPSLLNEVVQLKTKQRCMETLIKTMTAQIETILLNNNKLSGLQHTNDLLTDSDKIMLTENSQTCSKKPNTSLTNGNSKKAQTAENIQTCTKNLKNVWTETSTKEPLKNQGKTFQSISLQVAKAQEKLKKPEISLPAKVAKKKSTMKLSHGPPLHAKLKAEDESYYDFFLKHIDFYRTLKTVHPDCSLTFLDNAKGKTKTQSIKKVPNKLSVLHQNVEGISKKSNRLNHLIEETNPDVIIISKHGVKKDQMENTRLPKYCLKTHFSREDHRKGADMGMIKISLGKRQLYILGVYRTPAGQLEEALTLLSATIEETRAENHPILVMGDINVNSLKKYRENEMLNDTLSSHNITRLPLPPTRVTPTSKTSIDFICTNMVTDEITTNVIHAGISDHSAQICEITHTTTLPKQQSTRVFQKVKNDCASRAAQFPHHRGR
ncbi:PC4 and SFRS1-interacting protein [Homalodisca vitripennis]|nr:PC4 and SFRS1-interacting protein [Homalodisca vitripennis]